MSTRAGRQYQISDVDNFQATTVLIYNYNQPFNVSKSNLWNVGCKYIWSTDIIST